jgi:hypothetical protein
MTILTKLLGISGETSDRLNEAAERLGEAAENVEIDEDKVETASEFLSSVADKLDNTWNASLGEAIKDALPWLADAGEVAGEVLPPVKLALKVVSRLAREADPRALGLLAFSLAYQAAVMDGVKAIENDPGATAGMAQRLKPRLVRRVLAAEPERLESFEDFSLSDCLEHRLVRRADAMLEQLCDKVGWPPDARQRLLKIVHSHFQNTFRRILTDRDSIEKFDPLYRYLNLHSAVSQGKDDERHARALGLTVSHDDSHGAHELTIAVINRGTHVIEEIEINAIPDDDDWLEVTHGPLPAVIAGGGASAVRLWYPIPGAWFHAQVSKLNVDRGYTILRSELKDEDYTRIDFDVFWNDHTGMQRKAHAVADVRGLLTDVPLKPRRAPRP